MDKNLPDKLLGILKDKSGSLTLLIKISSESTKSYEGLERLMQTIDGANEGTMEKCMTTTMKVLRQQSRHISILSELMLIYMQSDSFDSDVAKMLGKLGKGQEALQQMMKNKMKG